MLTHASTLPPTLAMNPLPSPPAVFSRMLRAFRSELRGQEGHTTVHQAA